MKISISFIVLAAFAGSFVQSKPLDKIEIGSDVSLDEIKGEIEKILKKLEIEIPKDLSPKEWVRRMKLEEKKVITL